MWNTSLAGALLALAAATVSTSCGDDSAPPPAVGDGGMPTTDSGGTDSGSREDELRRQREECTFEAGAHPTETLAITETERAAIPIEHVLVFMQENRSFDHYFGRLPEVGFPDVDGIPADFTNPIPSGGTASPVHATTTCISPDIPHNWVAMHVEWGEAMMDGFFEVAAFGGHDGQRALAYYDDTDLPFYYWLYTTFAMSDRMFSSVLGPTWPNRDYLYAATSEGIQNTGAGTLTDVPTIFSALTDAGVDWKVYVDGSPRTDCLGWTSSSPGLVPMATLFDDLASGDLPAVAFIDVWEELDEHPPNDVQQGEAFLRDVVVALVGSPAWMSTALVYTYDEAGGFFDHVPPPPACVPNDNLMNIEFDRMGFRIPIVIVSPWAKPHYVSHLVHETTSVTRFIEVLFDLPALTRRDANSDALLDMFDFSAPSTPSLPGTPPEAGTGGCVAP